MIATNVVSRLLHRVPVEHWEAENTVEEARKKAAEIYARHQEGSEHGPTAPLPPPNLPPLRHTPAAFCRLAVSRLSGCTACA